MTNSSSSLCNSHLTIKRMKILVIEDSVKMAEYLRKGLCVLNHEQN